MKTRRRQYDVSEDSLTVSRRNSRASTSKNAEENSETTTTTISTDLIIEILLRSPGKSIARCRCLSKLFDSTLRGPYFTEQFMTMSLARPRFLFTFRKDRELYFFSSPQARDSDENSSPVTADYHLKFKLDDYYEVCGHIRGLVCLADLRGIKERKETAPVICNPSTGQLLPLPKVKTSRKVTMKTCFGFDPVDKQLKVLTISSEHEHRVLTLGTQKLSWRRIECGIPSHWPISYRICINGGVYYVAFVNRSLSSSIVCFDVRFETFRFINKAEGMGLRGSRLVNYKGKLGVFGFTGKSREIELWVLEDAETHEWSKNVFVLPQPSWNKEAAKAYLIGVTAGTNEIVLCSDFLLFPFYVYYYNMERNAFRRVEIKGMDAGKLYTVDVSLNHVEDVKLMKNV